MSFRDPNTEKGVFLGVSGFGIFNDAGHNVVVIKTGSRGHGWIGFYDGQGNPVRFIP